MGRHSMPAGEKVQLPRSMRWKAYAVTWVLKVMMRTLRWVLWLNVEVRNRTIVPMEGPVLLTSNHISNLDAPLWGATLKRNGAAVAKAELFDNMFVSWILKIRGDIAVARGSDESRASVLVTIRDILENGGLAGIFPEGGIKRDRWSKGSFEVGLEVEETQFVVSWMDGLDKLLPSTSADIQARIEEYSPRMQKLIRKLPGAMKMPFLIDRKAKLKLAYELLDPDEYKGMDATELAAYAHKRCQDLAFD